ncbi:MAG: glycosyltransferase family 2 protein [Candidatus Levybacteria bacterium CG10_big_fil_rev_8_21_14_0_10_36_30]|nr:MAG: glycosyltransferase family 2 protein [Candidatus Levybacteria bacterium CG10_big_fil_rev_8_21_14_0_10_36_30]
MDTQEKLPELSIFFPFWNEEKNIEKVVTDAISVARDVAETWEIIMVDDGSTDKTSEIAKNLEKKHKNLKLIALHPNKGYGAALRAGLEHSQYKYVVFTDGDLQFDFSELTKFIEKIDSADIVIGYRKKRKDEKIFKRLLLMNLLKVWDFVLFGFYFRDIDCGFKMFTRNALDQLGSLRSDGAMITSEILAKSKKKKLKILQVGVEHYPRKYGLQTGANLFVIVRAILESLILWSDIHNGRI